MNNTSLLSLDDLDIKPGCISKSFRVMCAEACVMTLYELSHRSGETLQVSGLKNQRFQLVWSDKITQEMRNTWTEQNFTTDQAAVAMSFLLMPKLTDFSVIHRSRKGTGFDYWVAPSGTKCDEALPFDRAARLEISGIYRGSNGDIQKRVQQKIEQTKQSDGTRLPAYVIVIEFSKLNSTLVKRD
jgi:hypothetical protein